jgi:uncharacterized membrane protein YobD (UPF0266 family)
MHKPSQEQLKEWVKDKTILNFNLKDKKQVQGYIQSSIAFAIFVKLLNNHKKKKTRVLLFSKMTSITISDLEVST